MRAPRNQKILFIVAMVGISLVAAKTSFDLSTCDDYCLHSSDFELLHIPHAYADDLILTEECMESTWMGTITTADADPVYGVSVNTIAGIRETDVEKKFTADENGSVEIPFYDNTGFIWIHKGGFNDKKVIIEKCELPQMDPGDGVEVAVPGWIKQTTEFWSDGLVSDGEYIAAIRYLITEKIIVIPGYMVQTGVDLEDILPTIDEIGTGWSVHSASDSYGNSCDVFPHVHSAGRFYIDDVTVSPYALDQRHTIMVSVRELGSFGYADVCYASWRDYMDSLYGDVVRGTEIMVWKENWRGFAASEYAFTADWLAHNAEMVHPDIPNTDDCTGIIVKHGYERTGGVGFDLACVKDAYAILVGGHLDEKEKIEELMRGIIESI